MGIERKFRDGTRGVQTIDVLEAGGGFSPNNAGAFRPMNGIAQGDGASERDGRQVTIKSIQLDGNFSMPAASSASIGNITDIAPIVRLVVVLDRQNNASSTPPAWSTVFDTAPAAAQDDLNYMCYRNLSNNKRFKILVDKRYVLPSPSITLDTTQYHRAAVTKAFHIYRKVPIITEYIGTDFTGASISTNAIWVLALVNHAVPTEPVVGSYICRVRYCG